MTAPIATTRLAPGGIPLKDGYQALITLALDTDISFWEKSVQPPSVDGGEPIDSTTMHNTKMRTFTPRSLITLGDVTSSVEYDPNVYNQIMDVINVPTTITVEWGDGSSIAFYGYLQKFEPESLEEGSPPLATVTIVPTNWDATANTEEEPVITSVSGT